MRNKSTVLSWTSLKFGTQRLVDPVSLVMLKRAQQQQHQQQTVGWDKQHTRGNTCVTYGSFCIRHIHGRMDTLPSKVSVAKKFTGFSSIDTVVCNLRKDYYNNAVCSTISAEIISIYSCGVSTAPGISPAVLLSVLGKRTSWHQGNDVSAGSMFSSLILYPLSVIVVMIAVKISVRIR